jgi:hypothetical protein
MRTLMKVQICAEAGNRGIKDGTLPDIIRKTLETVQAEAAYFTTMDGQRTMIAVFDLKAASDIPRIAEPLFMGLNASVDFMPCMNAEDLKAGLSTVK